eukprot:Nitzschia sp. Nitz4//NODE_444_length_18484_cov_71.934560//28//5304//NITZ4_additional_000056-RA//-1//CDS//3329531893//2910//frame0
MKLFLLGFLSLLSQALAATSPSTTVDSYILTHLDGIGFTSILTVDDGVMIPKANSDSGETTQLVGTPDGLAFIDGVDIDPADTNYFYLLANHELDPTAGGVRDHGAAGAFVSKWKIAKDTLEVVEGDDLIKEFYSWNWTTEEWVVAPNTALSRLCSGDRPRPAALYNSATGLGTQEIMYFTGEESAGGRALAHVVTGDDAGHTYELAHFGYTAIENIVFNPLEQDISVAVITDDSANGEVYVYVGTKQAEGNDVEKAGLVGGNLYAIAVEGKPYDLDDVLAKRVKSGDRFHLKPIGMPQNRPMDGDETTARSVDDNGEFFPNSTVSFASLKFPGPEDSAWDFREGMENNIYFAVKGGYFAGSSVNGLTAPSRLYRLEFDDISDPTLGGTLHIDYETLRSYDNIAVEIVNDEAKVYIQEDNGSNGVLGKIMEYDIATGSIAEIAAFDPELFYTGGAKFLTTNEESSGIISLKDVLGEGYFASSVQVHSTTGLSDSSFLVEHGQIVIFHIEPDHEADATYTEVISSGDAWDYRVDGADPGSEWMKVGFSLDDAWNVNTAGESTGSAPTPIGYGEAEGTLGTDVGQPEAPRPAAYFFRKEFDLSSPEEIVSLALLMLVDDGAVFYLNGVEVNRYQMAYDAEITYETFAATGETSEKNWKYIPITNFDSLTLLETGNVLAVSMHQDEPTSSDIRLDCKLTVIHSSLSQQGSAPTTPSFANATALSYTEAEISWEALEHAQVIQVERQMEGDVAWEVVSYDLPGVFTSYTDASVSGGVYNYRIIAFNIFGRSSYSDAISVEIPVSAIPTIFFEDFEVEGSSGQFMVVDLAEESRTWSWVSWDYSTTGAMQSNGYGGDGPTEDWLIMANPINFHYLVDPLLMFDAAQDYSGPLPQVLYSDNYDPAIHSNPNDANWTLIVEDDNTDGTLTAQGPFDISDIAREKGRLAWVYTSAGGGGGESSRYTVDDIEIQATCGFNFEGTENGDVDGTWQTFNRNSAADWYYDTQSEIQGVFSNNYGSEAGGDLGDVTAENWLVGPSFAVVEESYVISFDYFEGYSDSVQAITVYITDDWTGDVTTTNWVDVTPDNLDGSTSFEWISVSTAPLPLQGDDIVVAFLYQSSGNGGGSCKLAGVDHICIEQQSGELVGEFSISQYGADVTVISGFNGGSYPYSCTHDFGDGSSSTECSPTHTYTTTGDYTISSTIVDNAGVEISQTSSVSVTSYTAPSKDFDVRVSVFNTAFSDTIPGYGALQEAMKGTDNSAAKATAEVIQFANADVIALNEFDHVWSEDGVYDKEATLEVVANFQANYLGVSQNGQNPVHYDYVFVAPCNTGVQSGYDLDNDGATGSGNDAFGFGIYPGQYSLVFLSNFPIIESEVRTFQTFLWKDMPGAYLPTDPLDSDGDGDTSSYYNSTELEIFRLSSKSHWDIPCDINGATYHFLVSHPTPPVFDDGEITEYPSNELIDWNGLRNHDEIRFWADYISGEDYIYDDDGVFGGMANCTHFVLMGDQNADPIDGDTTFDPALMLLNHDRIDTSITPVSDGAAEEVDEEYHDRETKTSSFDLRVDYVLPSKVGWTIEQAAVFWPVSTDIEYFLLDASDHRLVMVDFTLANQCDAAAGVGTGAPTAAPTGGSGAMPLGFRTKLAVLAVLIVSLIM